MALGLVGQTVDRARDIQRMQSPQLPPAKSHLRAGDVSHGGLRLDPRTGVRYAAVVGTWHDSDLGRPIAAPLARCAELLDVELATIRGLAADIQPYVRADGTEVWSLMLLERQLRPKAFGRRRGGYIDRRRTADNDA
jgi:hypothetical protein